MDVMPPYLNKMEERAKKDLFNAEKKEIRAKKNYEFAQEYKQLCQERLDKINEKK